jgi:hypothetical protein
MRMLMLALPFATLATAVAAQQPLPTNPDTPPTAFLRVNLGEGAYLTCINNRPTVVIETPTLRQRITLAPAVSMDMQGIKVTSTTELFTIQWNLRIQTIPGIKSSSFHRVSDSFSARFDQFPAMCN